MTNPTDDIPVLASDIQLFHSTMSAVLAFLHANDLADQYRKLDNRNRRSPLTNAVADVVSKLRTYMESEVPEDD